MEKHAYRKAANIMYMRPILGGQNTMSVVSDHPLL